MPKPETVEGRSVLSSGDFHGAKARSISMSVKLDGFLRSFRGKGDNLSAFWSKYNPHTISQLVTKARAIQASSGATQAAAAAMSGWSTFCYSCGQVGHFSKSCPRKEKAGGSVSSVGSAGKRGGKGVQCYEDATYGGYEWLVSTWPGSRPTTKQL